LKYHPQRFSVLMASLDQAARPCQAGSLTGAVASKKVTEAPKGSLRLNGNQSESVKAQGSLTARVTTRAESKDGLSDLTQCVWKRRDLSDKSYPGDNRLVKPKRSQRRLRSAPRCRLVASWGWNRSQGLGCSPIKAARELGSERRETVRSLSTVGGGGLRGAVPSTRGPGWTDRWCAGCGANCIAG
jgi:hypothetical protein